MRVASSRLDIVNEADSLVQKTQQQADHFRKLKKKAMSLPVIGSIDGTVGGVLLIRMFTGEKAIGAPASCFRKLDQFPIFRSSLKSW
ncbi:MAG: hypothetical protein ACLT8E_07420 [Akkermansia sp.]